MHVQTHLLSGWCVANVVPGLTARERLFAMFAASIADADGLGIFVNPDYYMRWHHVAGHNLAWALVSSALLTVWSTHRAKAFLLYLALFHLHLFLDYFGSGPGWGISYFWPLSNYEIINPKAWDFYSWQNMAAFSFFLAWTVALVFWKKRTPLEGFLPSMDSRFVAWVTRAQPTV